MNFIIYDVFYSQYSQQHFSAGYSSVFRVMFLLHENNFDQSPDGRNTGRNMLLRILWIKHIINIKVNLMVIHIFLDLI